MPGEADPFNPHELLAHAAWLRRLAARLVGPSSQVEDLVQDTWTQALARPPADGRSLRPWLRVVLQNLARLRLRGDARRQRREHVASLSSEPLPSADALLARHEILTLLAQLVAGLEEPYRSTVLLCYGEDLAPAEIARRQGVPAGTVRWRLKRGLDQLRDALDERHGGRRRAWVVALSPLAAPALIKGGLALVKTKTKLAVGAALLVALLGGILTWWGPGGGGPGLRAPAPLSGPALRRASEDIAEPGLAAVEGRVIDEQGRAVPAAVALAPDPAPARRSVTPLLVTAGPDGRYRAERLAAGRYRISAAAVGFLPTARSVTLATGDRQTAVDLVLASGGHTLSGRVLDSGGGSIAAAIVRVAVDASGLDGEPFPPMAVAGADGGFQVTLPRGRHAFRVEADGYAPETALVHLQGDQRRDFRLSPAGQLAGRVVQRGSSQGEPGAQVRLECAWQGRPSVAETESTEDGRFAFVELPPGDCALVARKGSLAGRIAGGLVVELGARVSGLVVPLDPGRSLSGVVAQGSRPLAGVHVRFSEDVGDPGGDDGLYDRWRDEVLSGADGRFEITGVLPGAYRLRPVGRGLAGRPVSITVGDRNLEGLRLEAQAAGTLLGLVTDAGGAPAAGAIAFGRIGPGAAGPERFIGPVRSGADGRFVLEAPPGPVALDVDHPTLGEAIGGVEQLQAGEQRQLTIKLGDARQLRIRGRVRWEGDKPGAAGPPAAGLPVHATSWRANSARTTTGADGRFELAPFAPGRTIMVGVQHLPWTGEGTPTTTRAVKLGQTDAVDVEILVPPVDGRIGGRALGPDGHPLAGAAVRTRPGRADAVVVTGEDGSFVIDELPRGAYALRAEHPGLPAVDRVGVRTGTSGVELRFATGGRLRGRATRQGGGSAAPCAVWALPIGPRPLRTDQGVTSGMAREWVSAPAGDFDLGPLAAGAYHLYAVSPEGLVGHLPAVDLTAGGERNDLQLELRAGSTLEGRVTDFLTKAPVSGARLRGSALGRAFEAISGDDGRFQLRGLVPGSATVVHVDAPGYMNLRRTIVMPPDGRREARDVALVPEERGRKTPQKGSVGVVVAQDDQDRVVVRAAPAGLPAAGAGLGPGDVILRVDGLDVTEIGVAGVVPLLRGDPGTPLVLRVLKPDGNVREVRLVRV